MEQKVRKALGRNKQKTKTWHAIQIVAQAMAQSAGEKGVRLTDISRVTKKILGRGIRTDFIPASLIGKEFTIDCKSKLVFYGSLVD